MELVESKQIHIFTTPDKWEVALYRTEPAEKLHEEPVLLIHGLGSNRFNWDVNENYSFARWLAVNGYDVWNIDLRGRGESKPKEGVSNRWCVDDYIRYDLPGAIAYILLKTGKSRIDLIGHSMGGMIIYAYLGLNRVNPVNRAISIGSPGHMLDMAQLLKYLAKLKELANSIPMIPAKLATKMAFYMFGAKGGKLNTMLFNPANIDDDSVKDMAFSAVENLSRGELVQFAHWVNQGDIFSLDGKVNYSDHYKNITTPFLFLAGQDDKLAPPSSVQYVYDRVSSKERKFVIASAEHGFALDYGHIDLVLGKYAQTEIFPILLNWLNAEPV